MIECSECGHLHFDATLKLYVRCPLAPECECPLDDNA